MCKFAIPFGEVCIAQNLNEKDGSLKCKFEVFNLSRWLSMLFESLQQRLRQHHHFNSADGSFKKGTPGAKKK